MFSENTSATKDTSTDERRCWKLFLEGDLKAWEQIFKLFYKDLYGYGLKLSARPELTKECIHELFVDLWDRRNHLDEATSVKAYLLASLRRKLLKTLKKERKYFADFEFNEMNASGGIQFSPEEVIIKRERKDKNLRALYEALDALPDRQKEVVYLKYFNGMSYDEMEEILGINYQSIRNHICRAVKRLRDILDKNIAEIAVALLPICLSFLLWL